MIFEKSNKINRRSFFKLGAAGTAGIISGVNVQGQDEEELPKIKEYRVLGRTGFKVSDIAMGGTRVTNPAVVRYAYDHGINYFDTAEGYSNGQAERCIGESMPFMDRSKIFITTKLHLNEDESEQSIISRFEQCLKRLNTDYADCLYMHNPDGKDMLNHTGFHSAVKQLRSEKKLKYIGLSSHGPRNRDETMESVLTAAAEDGRFDVVLMVFNFLNREAGERVLAVCKKNNVGATAMKISPKFVKVDPYDPGNPTSEQKRRLDRMMSRGRSKEEAEKQLLEWMKEQEQTLKDYQPMFEKYGVKTEDDLYRGTIQWVQSHPEMHTACISFSDFDLVDKVVPVSGTRMSDAGSEMLQRYGKILDKNYCRHGCTDCSSVCPENIPVSTIMRYSYYALQGREKDAIQKYTGLGQKNAIACHTCEAPCLNACPHHLNVQANLIHAHSMLTLT
jgi:predicted aldo/keto reductase-like oxidoreductase